MEAKAFWNARASLGEQAGTQDTILHRLEVEEIAKHIKDGMRVLDVGCGNGATAIELAQRFNIDIDGMDYADEMVNVALRAAFPLPMKGVTCFWTDNVLDMTGGTYEAYDLIYTKRCIINLPDWPTQRQAIRNILNLLKPGGQYLACECCQEGLDGMNQLRVLIGLSPIIKPFHNRYLYAQEMTDLAEELMHNGTVEEWSVGWPISTYYFLSRLVNAYVAAQKGEEPNYDAPVNRLALRLPSIGQVGQNRFWVYRKGAPS